MKNKINKLREKGFTLIELLVVIAIIEILAGILFVAINPKEQTDKANDAKRLLIVKELQKALEMYKLDHGVYPDDESTSWGVNTWHDNTSIHLRNFENELKPYLNIDLKDKLWGPYFNNGDGFFWYSVTSENNYQTYALAIRLVAEDNHKLMEDDGGYNDNYYEVGQDPKYCMDKYNGKWNSSNNTRCADGN